MLSTTIFIIGVAALYNSVQCFIPAMNVTNRIYANSPKDVSPLASRLMGTWTFLAGIIRIYTSMHLDDKGSYDLCLATFVLALFHFLSEVFVYKSAPISSPGVWPALLVSSSMAYWMLSANPVFA